MEEKKLVSVFFRRLLCSKIIHNIVICFLFLFLCFFSYTILDIKFKEIYKNDLEAYNDFLEVYDYFDSLCSNNVADYNELNILSLPKNVIYQISSNDGILTVYFYSCSTYSVPDATFTLSDNFIELTPISKRYATLEKYQKYIKSKHVFDTTVFSIICAFVLLIPSFFLIYVLFIGLKFFFIRYITYNK